ncbi:MAG: Maf family protein [Burkholderiaceae bacterium]|nr:Maf family protein [Burkholderiaceae bacterium]
MVNIEQPSLPSGLNTSGYIKLTHIYLASASPRRSDLLKQIGIEHTVLKIPAAPGEDEPRHAGESPLQYVQRTASDKAELAVRWIASQKGKLDPDLAVLTADTTVALGELVLGKPSDALDAKKILSLLSDQTHIVYTAVVLSHGDKRWQTLSTSRVSFSKLTEADIEEYIATLEPFGKAGAYGIQGFAAKFISKLEGSYTGVMGLPLYETAVLLKKKR